MSRDNITVVSAQTLSSLLQSVTGRKDGRGRPASPRLVAIRNIGKKGGVLFKEPDVTMRVLRNRLCQTVNRENKRRADLKLPRLRTSATKKGLLIYAL